MSTERDDRGSASARSWWVGSAGEGVGALFCALLVHLVLGLGLALIVVQRRAPEEPSSAGYPDPLRSVSVEVELPEGAQEAAAAAEKESGGGGGEAVGGDGPGRALVREIADVLGGSGTGSLYEAPMVPGLPAGLLFESNATAITGRSWRDEEWVPEGPKESVRTAYPVDPSVYGVSRRTLGGLAFGGGRVGIILDRSWSMRPHLEEIRGHLREVFPGQPVIEVEDCSLALDDDGSVGAVLDAARQMVEMEQVASIYWVCDLQDERSFKGLESLRYYLYPSGRSPVSLYVTSYDRSPDDRLSRLVIETRGKVECLRLSPPR